jgi:hypothetical protein
MLLERLNINVTLRRLDVFNRNDISADYRHYALRHRSAKQAPE